MLTVGLIKKMIADLPDGAPIYPRFTTIPNDDEPGIEFTAITVDEDKNLCIGVKLFYLNDDEDDEDDITTDEQRSFGRRAGEEGTTDAN